MIDFSNTKIENIIVHKVGNKSKDEGVKFSNSTLNLQGDIINELLLKFFLSSFKNENLFRFYHETDININETYLYTSKILENENSFFEQSKNLTNYLYIQSDHPKINSGEFYVVLISGCIIDDEIVNAVGLFKTENKDTYIRVKEKDENFEIDYESGININKLDKGCLIFNTEKENGFIVRMVDNINKSGEAQYWKENFLKIKPREDNYYFTQNYLNICKKFVDKGIDEIEKTEQVELKNNTMNYFAEKDTFDIDEFKNEVISNSDTKQAFKEYLQDYQNENDILLSETFDISKNAVKKEKRKFKSVIKLDKNYDIYIRANHLEVENGYDRNKEKKYYKLFYDIEK